MNKNKKEEIIKDNIYKENMTDEQKQKRRDYQKEYYKNYYAEKKLTIKDYNYS